MWLGAVSESDTPDPVWKLTADSDHFQIMIQTTLITTSPREKLPSQPGHFHQIRVPGLVPSPVLTSLYILYRELVAQPIDSKIKHQPRSTANWPLMSMKMHFQSLQISNKSPQCILACRDAPAAHKAHGMATLLPCRMTVKTASPCLSSRSLVQMFHRLQHIG